LLPNIKIALFDGSNNVLSCIHSDSSGNFKFCIDLSDGYLPCVINPSSNSKQTSKTHISDSSRCFPYYGYGYPYYGYGYPYYGYGYPYSLADDDYYNREIDVNSIPPHNQNNKNSNSSQTISHPNPPIMSPHMMPPHMMPPHMMHPPRIIKR
jgi:hypothetical protein